MKKKHTDSGCPLSAALRLRFLKGVQSACLAGTPPEKLTELAERAGLDPEALLRAPVAAPVELGADVFETLHQRYRIAPLAQLYSLTDEEARLLAVLAEMHLEDRLYKLISAVAELLPRTWILHLRLLAEVVGLSHRQLSRMLFKRATLVRLELVDVNRGSGYSFDQRFELRDELIDYLSSDSASLDALTGSYFTTCAAARLDLSHYPTLHAGIERALGRLRRRQPGTHILLYGPPGTGKTQLAHVLAEQLGWPLYAVPTQDSDADPIEHAQRLTAFAQAQRMLGARSDVLLLFDEVEDVMRASDVGRDGKTRAVSFKGWLHEQLEHAPLPTIWVSNSLAGFDEAQLRRYACILEVPIPGPAARQQTIDTLTAGLDLSAGLASALVERDDLSPAELGAAIREAEAMAEPERALVDALDARLRATGRERVRRKVSAAYDLRWVRTEPALERIEQFRRLDGARLLLSGPSGAGKTAFATHLARSLDRPLIVKRASDWLSPWVGETEQQIADSFARAELNGAVLLLDEADSFLAARHAQQPRWERSQVNEILKQLEAYEGWFCAATNWAAGLDPAVQRRFDFKFAFQWLDDTQRRLMFEDYCTRLGVTRTLSADALAHALAELRHLLPGDLAALRRRIAMSENVSDRELLAWARAEVALKPEARVRPMGFTRAA